MSKDNMLRKIIFDHAIFKICFLNLLRIICSENLKIYFNVNAKFGCFKLLNGSHSIGCSSNMGGTTGILFFIPNESILERFDAQYNKLNFILMIYPHLFNKSLIDKIHTMTFIKGLIIMQSKNESFYQRLENYSPDLNCPNEFSSLYENSEYSYCHFTKWNSRGQGIFFKDFTNFPIFLLKDEDTITYLLQNCYEKYNENILDLYTTKYSPICSVEMIFEMFAVKDSKTCLRRSQLENSLSSKDHCVPLGDYNVWSLYKPTNKSEPLKNRTLTVLAAKLDALTMFDGLSPSAESSILSLITFLAIVDALSWQRERAKTDTLLAPARSDHNILFLLLNGESFDYIGSSSLLFDMNLTNFPDKHDPKINTQLSTINTTHILNFIEIGQVALSKDRKFYIHSDPLSRKKNLQIDSQVNQIIEMFKAAVSKPSVATTSLPPQESVGNISSQTLPGLSIGPVSTIPDPNFPNKQITPPLPPSSLQMFLRHDTNISGIYIADHEKEYHNRFYNSPLDTLEYVTSFQGSNTYKKGGDRKALVNDITDLATLIARVLFNLTNPVTNATGKANSDFLPGNLNVNRYLIQTLIECYLVNPSCDYWKMFSAYIDLTYQKTPLSNYVSVVSHKNPFTLVTQLTLAYLSRDSRISINAQTARECRSQSSNASLSTAYKYYWFENIQTPSAKYHNLVINESRDLQNKMPISMCVASLTSISLAESPAFRMSKLYGDVSEESDTPSPFPDYDVVKNIERYSTWVESTWAGEPKLRVYLASNTRTDWHLIIAGFLVCAFTSFIILVSKRYHSILFENSLLDPNRRNHVPIPNNATIIDDPNETTASPFTAKSSPPIILLGEDEDTQLGNNSYQQGPQRETSRDKKTHHDESFEEEYQQPTSSYYNAATSSIASSAASSTHYEKLDKPSQD